MQRKSLSIGTVALAVVCGVTQAQEGTTSFLHFGEFDRQLVGRFKQCDFEFTLWDAPEGGERIGRTLIYDGWETNKARVPVDDGYFEVVLDFGVEIYDDEPVYVESRSACGRNAKWVTVSRVVVTEDLLVEDDRLTVVETPIGRVTPSKPSRPARIDEFGGPGESGGTFNNTLEAADGDPSPAVEVDADGNTSMVGDLTVGGAIKIDGDNNPLEIHVNGVRALRFEYADAFSEAPNVIGGSPSNSVVPQKAGAVIAGGGSDTGPNQVSEDWGTVSGGRSNHAFGMFGTVSGGSGNTATGEGSTVSGGQSGDALGAHSTVGGGLSNAADGDRSTVAGGTTNTAAGAQSVIGGGEQNSAVGAYSTVPGGFANAADADYSFAAGRRAKALHLGSFVWADSTPADFASTAADQFRVRASGGISLEGNVGIGTTNPLDQLHVYEPGTPSGWRGRGVFSGDAAAVVIGELNGKAVVGGHNPALSAWSDLILNPGPGNVGIGTTDPATRLHIIGGTDTAPGGGGYVTLGTTTGFNISIDNNEIMARNSGAVSTLFLNANGGDVRIGGNLHVDGNTTNFVHSGPFTAVRRNTPGFQDVTMTAVSKSFCALTYVDIEQNDAQAERAICNVYSNGVSWVLRAQLTGCNTFLCTNNADVICQARCFVWDN